MVQRLIETCDGCFHLAAIASVQKCNDARLDSHAVNQGAFVTLLDCISKRKNGVIPLVYASSAAIYGDTDIVPVHEDLPPRPISNYGADKAGCELQALAAGRMLGIPTFGLRPFNIYGPRQHPGSPYSGVITIFADRLKHGKSLTIYGDGKQTRDFIHVRDVVDFFIAALDQAATTAPVCNVATGHETSINDIARSIATILGIDAKIDFAPARTGDIYRSLADISYARDVLGCEARIDISEGLKFIRI